MLKVFIVGYDEPYSIVGNKEYEDERYLYLNDGGKKIKIPHKRIAYIEDWTDLGSTDETQEEDPKQLSTIVSKEPPTRESLLKKLDTMQKEAMRSSQVDADDAPESPLYSGLTKKLLIFFTGAKEAQFSLDLPVEICEGQYTPALGREIFKNPEIQAFMSGDLILEGMPTVKSDLIQFKVKPNRTIKDMTTKLDFLNKAGTALSGNYGSLKTTFESGFSMPKNPFEELPVLTGSAPHED